VAALREGVAERRGKIFEECDLWTAAPCPEPMLERELTVEVVS
jgi:hypothetical protein